MFGGDSKKKTASHSEIRIHADHAVLLQILLRKRVIYSINKKLTAFYYESSVQTLSHT